MNVKVDIFRAMPFKFQGLWWWRACSLGLTKLVLPGFFGVQDSITYEGIFECLPVERLTLIWGRF
jgi:hypothetical protein